MLSRQKILTDFVVESWKIEGLRLDKDVASSLADYHGEWATGDVSVETLSEAASSFTNGYGRLRVSIGMDVRVGDYFPPRGGPSIEQKLCVMCASKADPFARHIEFERIHPFIDGNGRVGRLLWLRDMLVAGWSVELGFLHTFYYQTLKSSS